MEKKFVTVDQIETIVCPIDEQEFTVCGYRKDSTFEVFCSDQVMLTKLKKSLATSPDEVKCWEGSRDSEGNMTGYFFSMPKKFIALKKAINTRSKNMTQEEKDARAQRMRDNWVKRKASKDVEEE